MPTPPLTRSGAHRSRLPAIVELVPLGLVAVALIAVVLGVLQLKDAAIGGATPTAAGSSPRPTAERQGSAKAPTPTDSAVPPGTPGPTPSTSAPGEVRHSIAVGVYNGTKRSGLASREAAALRSAGWQASALGNFRDRTVSTTVFYPSSDLEATAQAVAKDIGGEPAVQQSTEFDTQGLTVVLGSDFSG